MLVLAGSTVFPWKARPSAVISSWSRLEVCSEIEELPRDGHSGAVQGPLAASTRGQRFPWQNEARRPCRSQVCCPGLS